MGTLLRAVISGFGFSLGKAIFDRLKDQMGLGDVKDAKVEPGDVTEAVEVGNEENNSPD